jgi:hypothetical protein
MGDPRFLDRLATGEDALWVHATVGFDIAR